MEKMVKTEQVEVKRLVLIDPDWLLEVAHRMKQVAMDSARLGEAVLSEFTDGITLVYYPDSRHSKPRDVAFEGPAAFPSFGMRKAMESSEDLNTLAEG